MYSGNINYYSAFTYLDFGLYCRFSPYVMAPMLVYSYQKNFDYFFCSGHQHGRYVYCLLCLLGLCENQEFPSVTYTRDKSLYFAA